jgi:glycosyltransferase involved in cell wall biosynthesis
VKVAAAVLTWQQYETGRHDLFKQTVESLAGAVDHLFVVDNGSTDGTAEYVKKLGGYSNPGPVTSCGYGMNLSAAICQLAGADLVVLSNDDIIWYPDAIDRLTSIWEMMPEDVKIVSGLLQAGYPWNQATGREGPVLIRDTVPGGAWTYRSVDYPLIFPVPTKPGWDDVPTCRRLTNQRFRVGAVDLAEHGGEASSSWGNASHRYEIATVAQVKASWGL